MIKGRTPNIRTEHVRAFANKLVASANNKYGNRAISKEKFKELMQHVPVHYASKIRGSQKNLTTYQTKKFLGEFIKHIQEHPDYKVSTFARKALNVKLHQGDNVIKNFSERNVGEKALGAVAEIQQEADAAKNTGPTPEELKRQERRRLANIAIGRSQRLRAEDAGKKASGFANPNVKTGYVGSHDEKAGSFTRSKDVQTSVTGEVKTAGQPTPTTPIPGQHAPAPQSRASVQLAGGIGLSRIEGKPADRTDDVAIPRIGIAKDSASTEKSVPTPGIPTEVTDIRPAKEADDELPSMEDIDKNLPLAA